MTDKAKDIDAKLNEEFERTHPDELEMEDGKIAQYDPKYACWIYIDDQGREVAVHI